MVFGCFFRWSDHPIPRSVQDLGLARHVLLGSEELLQAWATGSTTRLWSGNLVYCIESHRSFWGCFWGCNGDIFLVSNEIMIYSKPQKVNQTVGKLDLFFCFGRGKHHGTTTLERRFSVYFGAIWINYQFELLMFWLLDWVFDFGFDAFTQNIPKLGLRFSFLLCISGQKLLTIIRVDII